jgi:gamma-glutamylputrescine oxidase
MQEEASPSKHVPLAASQPDTWYHHSTQRPFSLTAPLEGECSADIIVIGAGYTGVSAALDLAEVGLRVVVLEAGEIGAGASGRNGGLACSGWRRDQEWFENRLGAEDARRFWNLAEDAKKDLRARMLKYAIKADWTSGQIFAAHTHYQLDQLDVDASFLLSKYRYTAQSRLNRAQVTAALGTDVYVGGWRDDTAGHVHPLKLLYGLAGAARDAGVVFHEGSRVVQIGQSAGGDGLQQNFARTQSGRIVAPHVLLCGDGYLDGIAPDVEAHVLPIGSFVLATDPLPDDTPILPKNESAMDTRFVVNYWRKTADNRLIFGGGEKYTPSWPTDVKTFVRKNLLKIYPELNNIPISHAWGGALGITPTRLPFLRQVSPGVLSSSGYSGQGVVLAPYFGRLLAQAVLGQMEGYDLVSRLPVPHFPGGRALRWPLLTAAMSWYALRDKLP